jgi:hypothetical protein
MGTKRGQVKWHQVRLSKVKWGLVGNVVGLIEIFGERLAEMLGTRTSKGND